MNRGTEGMHTPGPWEAKETPHSSNQNFVVLDGGKPHNKRVCAVYSAHEEADARLIAAAPDLLAALERVRDAYGFDPSIESSIWQEVNAAITKATGK